MKKRLIRKFVAACVMVLLALVAFTPRSGAAEWSPGPMPKALRVASYEVGGAMYIICAGIGEGIYKKFGIRLRTLPVGTGTARILNVRVGNTDFGVTSDSLFASEGLYDYANETWGPQPLRMVYISNRQSAWAFATGAGSGIKTMEDLKGKRLPAAVGSPFTKLTIEGALAFAGLKPEDVRFVEFRSMAAMYDSVIEGTTDAAPLDSLSSAAYKLEASPKGIYWIPCPVENKEGWKRFQAVLPEIQPVLCKYGPGLSEKKAVWLPTVPFPQYVVYADADEKKVYWIVKMMAESYNEYKDIAPALPWHKPEEAIKANSVLPYHAGAVRYFKEKGLWTAQLEKNQKELIERQAALRGVWDSTVEEALAKGVKAEQFGEFWMKKRAEKFPNFWVQTPVN